MKRNKKYVVKVRIRYVDMEFEFDSVMGACNFMDLFLDHFTPNSEDGDAEVYMMRVDEEEIEEEKGEEE